MRKELQFFLKFQPLIQIVYRQCCACEFDIS